MLVSISTVAVTITAGVQEGKWERREETAVAPGASSLEEGTGDVGSREELETEEVEERSQQRSRVGADPTGL